MGSSSRSKDTYPVADATKLGLSERKLKRWQDLFTNIEAKEAEEEELERSVKLLDQRLSLVQVTCDAASRKRKLSRGDQVTVSN